MMGNEENTTKNTTKNDQGQTHGVQQNIKMELLGMVHSAENPFDIICHIAEYLEKESAEIGYAKIIRENIRSIYGLALGEKKLMQDELEEVIARSERIQDAYEHGDFTEDEKTRIASALMLHRKNAQRLEEMIRKAKIEGTSPYCTNLTLT